MLTGDRRETAEAVARGLPIDEVHAGLLPHDKADAVARLQASGRSVAMAGDGINDAPALARARVGIAMGTGSDVAIESAGVTLVKGDLAGVVCARGALPRDDGEHPPKPGAGLRLQPGGRAHRGGDPLSVLRAAPQPSPRRRRDEPQLRLGHYQRAAPAPR